MRKQLWDQWMPPGACSQVACVGDLSWRGWSGLKDIPWSGWPRASQLWKSSFFFYDCVKRAPHADLPRGLGLLLPALSLPSHSLGSFWQLDSKGTPSLAHQWPGGKLPAAQKPAPAHCLPHTEPSHTGRGTSVVGAACT